jgi:hypothetical protein
MAAAVAGQECKQQQPKVFDAKCGSIGIGHSNLLGMARPPTLKAL